MTAPSPKLPILVALSAIRDLGATEAWAVLIKTRDPNVVYAKLLDLAGRDYLDYGTTAKYPWLTDKGRAYLEAHK